MGEPQDEISLRELYLILKRGMRWILVGAIGAAVLAFVVVQLQPRQYQATATVRISPLQVQGQTLQNGQLQQDLIDINSVTQIGFDAYRTIALSHGTLQNAIRSTTSLPSGYGAKQLAEAVSLTKVSGGGSDPLIVAHEVAAVSPQRAADLANAWANASADAVRASIGKTLGGVRATMSDQVASMARALSQAEAQWASFQKHDQRSSLKAQLDALDSRTTTAQQTLDELDRNIATAKAQQSLLQSVIDARVQGKSADLSEQMQALTNQGVLSTNLAQQLADALALVPGNPAVANQDLATLVARAQLQQQTADLAGYAAERQTVSQQLNGFSTQASDLRDQLATQQQTAQQLQRELDTAQSAYDKVSQTAPLIDVADKLVPSMAGVFNTASVPERPRSRHTTIVTLVAMALAFLAMVLVIFLRAAVAEEPDGDAHQPGSSDDSSVRGPSQKGADEENADAHSGRATEDGAQSPRPVAQAGGGPRSRPPGAASGEG